MGVLDSIVSIKVLQVGIQGYLEGIGIISFNLCISLRGVWVDHRVVGSIGGHFGKALLSP